MKKVYIIHCWGGNPKDGWYPWICNHLQKKEIEVKCLEMPNTNTPKIEEWIEKLEQEIDCLDEDTFFIGHSIGCQTIMRYLQRKKITKIGGILFVAPWLELSLKAVESEKDYNIAHPWLEKPLFLEKIKKFTTNITCIFSDDDYFVPLSQKRIFESKLSADCIVVHEKGHISEEDGVFELKEILLATFKMLGLEILEIVQEN